MWNRIYKSIRPTIPVFLLCTTLLSFNLNSANASNFFTNKISTVEGVNNFVASIYDTILNLFVKKTKEVYVPVPVYIPDKITTPVSEVVVDDTTKIYNNNLLSSGTQKEFVSNNVLNISSGEDSNSNDEKEYVEMEFFQNQVETIYNSIYNSTTANIDSHTETVTHGGGSSGISFATVDLGGTGISTVPNYGELLMGDGLGGYSLVATSSLGLLGGGGSSQWTTNGSDIYYTTGNVGIGTTSPYAKLSVSGSIVMGNFSVTSTATSTIAGGLSVGTATSSGLVTLRSVHSGQPALAVLRNTNFSATTPLQTWETSTASRRSWFDGNGLKINTDPTLSNAITIYRVGDDSLGSIATSIGNYSALIDAPTTYPLFLRNTSGGVNQFFLSGGDITTTQGTNIGSLRFVGNSDIGYREVARFNVVAETNFGGAGSSKASMVFSTNDDLIPTGIVGGFGTPVYEPRERMRIASNGNIGIASTSPFAMLSIMNGGSYLSQAPSTSFAIGSSTMGLATSTHFIVTSEGRVGIGSTSPTSNLSVVGNSYFGGNVTIGATASGPQLTVNAQGNGNDTEFILGDGLGQYWGITRENSVGNAARGDLSFYSTDVRAGDLLTLGARGLVGIGTTSPYAKLSVSGTSVASTTLALRPISGQTANILDVYNTSGVLNTVITAGGSVGIGTTTPSVKLETYTTNTFSLAASSNNGSLWFGHDATTNFIQSVATNRTSAQNLYIGGYATQAPALTEIEGTSIFLNGNVGIGTTSPAGNLEVLGSTGIYSRNSSGGRIVFDDSDVASASTPMSYIIGADGSLQFGRANRATSGLTTGSVESLRITSTGNVGIGTTSPVEKLTVANGELSLVDDDITTGFTTLTTTNSIFGIEALSGTVGGAILSGYGESAATAGLVLRGLLGASDPTDATPAVQFRGGKQSGATGGTLGSLETAFQFSDWDGGTDWMTILGSGNVGIGTTSPNTLLTLEGSVGVLTINDTGALGTPGAGILLRRDGANKWLIQSNALLQSTDQLDFLANGTPVMSLLQGGNVGIGTTTPASLLHLSGNGGVPQLIISGTAAGQNMKDWRFVADSTSLFLGTLSESTTATGDYAIRLGRETNSNDVDYIEFATNNEANKMRFTNSGNLGIGTTTPDSRLTVNSDATLAGAASQLRIRGVTNPREGLRIGFDTTDNYSFIESVEDDVAYRNLSLVPRGGNVGIGTTTPARTLDVYGNASFSSISGDNSLQIGNLGNSAGVSFIQAANVLNNSPKNLALQVSGGNVGIGTTTPDYKLRVGGGSNTLSHSVASSYDGIAVNPTTAHAQVSVRNITGVETGMIAHSTVGGILGTWSNHPLSIRTNNTTRMTIDAFGNIGIGTTTPVAAGLTISAAATPQITLADQSLAAGNKNFLMRINGTVGTGVLQIGSAVDAGSANVINLNLDRSGNVGIGTTTPGANLDVNGTTRLGGPSAGVYPALVLNNKNADSSGVGTGVQFKNRNDASNYMGGIQTIYRGGITSALTMMDFFAGGDSVTPKMTLSGSGNLGIGTTTPGVARTVIEGSSNILSVLGLSNSSNTANSRTYLNFYDNTAENAAAIGSAREASGTDWGLIFRTGSGSSSSGPSDRMYISATGNVGIATTSPVALLSLGNGSGPAGTTPALGINFGDPSANLYRSSSGMIRTDGSLAVQTNFLMYYGNQLLINKAGNNWLNFATRDTTGPEAVYNLSSIGTITTSNTSAISTIAGPLVARSLLYPNGEVLSATSSWAIGYMGSSTLFYPNNMPLATADGTLYYGDSNILATKGDGLFLSAKIYYPNNNVLVDGTSLYYPAGSTPITDATGNLYYSNGNTFVDSLGNIYDMNSNTLLFDATNLFLRERLVSSDGTGGITITNSPGYVGISSTTPWRNFSVDGTVAMNGLTSSATGNALCITSAKELTDSGGASCTPSSIRFKENVTTLNPGYAMDTLSKLKVVHFDYKEKQPYETNHSYGLIAEEVANIDNNLVDYGYDGLPVSLHFEKITGLLVQAVQEQKAQIEEIKSQAFLDKIIKGVTDSFASVVVRMQTAFVGELHVQEKLCVDDVCINKDQLKIILMNSGGTRYIPDTNPQPIITNNNNTNNSAASSTAEETTPPQASTTPQVQTPIEQPSTEPTNTPEQTPTTPPVEPVVEVTTPNPEPVTPTPVEPAPTPEPAPISSPEPAPTEGQ